MADVEKAYQVIKSNRSIDRSGNKYPEFADAEKILKKEGWTDQDISDLRLGKSKKKLPARPSEQDIQDMQSRLQDGGVSDAEKEIIVDTLRAEGVDVAVASGNKPPVSGAISPAKPSSRSQGSSSAVVPNEFTMKNSPQQKPVPSEFLMTNPGQQSPATESRSWSEVRDAYNTPQSKMLVFEMAKHFFQDQNNSERVKKFYDPSIPQEEKMKILKELRKEGVDLLKIQEDLKLKILKQSPQQYPRKYENPGREQRGIDV
jgi:hypothetical protein